jgi:hypothetical protein
MFILKWLWEQVTKFSITKFLGGFNILNGAQFGKILFVTAIVLSCMFVVNKFFTPKQITQVSGQNVTVQQCSKESLDKMVKEARSAGKDSALIKIWFIRLF